jgi:electron transport complex protein RnfG
MKKMLWLLSSLTVIAGVCAAALAYVNELTTEPIAAMQEKKANAAAMAVMPPQAVKVEKKDSCFIGLDAGGKIVGYALEGVSGAGYGGDIVLMVGFEADRTTVVGYRALRASETPGLGTKLSTPEFSGQFAGKKTSKPIAVDKDGGEIESITSATITSRAVCGAVNDAAKKLAAVK